MFARYGSNNYTLSAIRCRFCFICMLLRCFCVPVNIKKHVTLLITYMVTRDVHLTLNNTRVTVPGDSLQYLDTLHINGLMICVDYDEVMITMSE